jgi:acyl-CoA thioester hydrolase
VRHQFVCPMRWADLDPHGHINNVLYVDYLQEARVDMLRVHAPDARAGRLADGVVVVRHDVEFVTPLTFASTAPGRQSVTIESWVTEIRAASFTIAYEIFAERRGIDGSEIGSEIGPEIGSEESSEETGPRKMDSERVVYARASTVLTPYVFATERPRRITAEERDGLARYLEPVLAPARRPVPVRVPTKHGYYPAHVRFSDVDVYGHVNNVKYFEYLQEARIALFAGMWAEQDEGAGHGGMAGARPLLVTQTQVDYRVPLLFRSQPYDVWTWVCAVDDESVVIDAEICDGDVVLSRARNVLRIFDPATGLVTGMAMDAQRVLRSAIRTS